MHDGGGSPRLLGRRDALRITAVAGVSVALGGRLIAALLRDARLHRVSRTRTQMGTLVTLTVVHPDPAAAGGMIADGFAEMERLENVLSRHRRGSALGRLNAHGVLTAAPSELLTVMAEALRLADATDGAFDPTILPVLKAYRRGFEATGGPPTSDVVDRALRLVGYQGVEMEGARIALEKPGMAVTLDGIAKGFIVDRCVDLLVAQGAERVLVDAGGDIATSGEGSAREPWTIAVQDPHQPDHEAGLVRLGGDAVATSGDYQNSFTRDRRLHHIIDPRTGRSPEETSSVSVVAPTAMKADGLSTAVMVLGPGPGVAFVDRTSDAEALVVTKGGRRFSSRGFPLLLLATVLCTTVFLALSATLPAGIEAQATTRSVPLFSSHEGLAVVLTADFTALEADRSESPDRPGTLTVVVDGEGRDIPVEIRTRGAFRLDPANCSFPPLRIDVDGDAATGTPFEGQDDLKFVSSCRPERASWEELVLKEYLAYRSIGLVTDESFRVRLLEASFVDLGAPPASSSSGEAPSGARAVPPPPRLAFVVEEDDALARRLGATVFDLEEGKNLPALAFHPVSRMTNAVAQYVVANPDWSGVAGHNVEILDRQGAALAIPYDFDFSGVVDAPYATAPPEYQLGSVRERYYRGWCENPVVTAEVLRRFREARDPVIALWSAEERLSSDARSAAIRFLEDFFDAVASDERAHRRFLRDCRPLPG